MLHEKPSVIQSVIAVSLKISDKLHWSLIGHREKKILLPLDLVKVAYIFLSLFFTYVATHRSPAPSSEVAIEWQKKFLLNT